ncbi:hypothetical protein BRC65_08825, partial [Halobacteriales archaeon QH_2_65_14]
MRFSADQRAQAIQIGAVLIFGILIVFLSLYQAFVVPNHNEGIEFNHNEEVRDEMTELRSTAVSMQGVTTTRSVSVTLGTRYPSRTIFVNPGPASGTLRTVGTTDERVEFTITNATAAGEVGDFWNGTGRGYNTGAIEYRPSYNLYTNAPRTIYEHSVLYNSFESGDVTQASTGQVLVRDDRITVVTLNGTFLKNRVGSASVEFEPVSTRSRTVEVTNETGPITLTVPTGMNEDEWQNVFEPEMVAQGGHVESVTTSDVAGIDGLSLLAVTLEAGETYTLQMGKIGVGTRITRPDEAYLTDVDGNGTTIQEDGTQRLELEVRDSFNGPVSGVTVNASAQRGVFTGSGTDQITKVTDSEGRITVEYRGLDDGTNHVNFSIAPAYVPRDGEAHEAGTPENVTMTVDVEPKPGSGGGGSDAAFNVTWQDPSGETGTETCDDESCTFNHSKADDLELTVDTNRTAQGATVEFAVGDENIGKINPGEATTNAAGETSTTFQPQANGTVDVYAWSGGSGDVIEIEVIDFQGGPFFDVDITGTNSTVREGETLTVDVNVTNTGG